MSFDHFVIFPSAINNGMDGAEFSNFIEDNFKLLFWGLEFYIFRQVMLEFMPCASKLYIYIMSIVNMSLDIDFPINVEYRELVS